MGYRELMRRQLLENIYEKMTEEEKKMFIQLTIQNKSHTEIMEAIKEQRQQLDEIEKGQNWTRSFGSDLLANFTSAGALWLGSKLLVKL